MSRLIVNLLSLLLLHKIEASLTQFPKIFHQNSSSSYLPNNLEFLTIECQEASQAGVSLSIGVGSNQDTVPGLSHLLEHMIFFSSKSYPKEDYLMEFISLNGGYSNAYTDFEHTTFYYSISNLALQDSLKIFSRAIVEPIFTTEAVQREILAVNSEHLKNIYNDEWRNLRLLQLAAGIHPLSNFNTGNAKTLTFGNISELVEAHFSKYYLAGKMKLVIYGNYSTEILESWVNEYFSDLKQGNYFNTYPEAFGDTQKLYVTNQIDEGISLHTYWKIPSQFLYPDTQPADFIGYLLGNQGEHGILESFEEILTFDVGVSVSLTDLSLVEAQFTLSSQHRYIEIIESLLGFVEKIAKYSEAELKIRWDDYYHSKIYEFDYSNKPTAENIASKISENMLYFPQQYYFSGFQLKNRYNYEEIINTLSFISRKSVVSIFASSSIEKGVNFFGKILSLNLHCDFYNLNYEILPLELSPIDRNYFIYPRNPYIPSEISLLRSPENQIEVIFSSPGLNIWYKFDESFEVPKTIISLLLFSDPWNEIQVDIELLLKSAQIRMKKDLYLYNIAGYLAEFSSDYNGASLRVEGWSSGILNYLEKVLGLLTTPDSSQFLKAQQSLYEEYSGFATEQPYKHAEDYLRSMILPSYFSMSSKLSYLISSRKYSTAKFLEALPKLTVQVLVLGNISKESSRGLIDILSKTFTLSAVARPVQASVPIQATKYFTSMDEENHCLFYWHDFGSFGVETWANVLVLSYLADDRAFRILRSQEQLGYVVFAKASFRYLSNSLVLAIQGSDKNPEEMEVIVQGFWNKFEIEDEVLGKVREQVAQSLEWPKESLKAVYDEMWKEVKTGRLEFDINERLVKAVRSVSIENIRQLLDDIRAKKNSVIIRIFKEETEALTNMYKSEFLY